MNFQLSLTNKIFFGLASFVSAFSVAIFFKEAEYLPPIASLFGAAVVAELLISGAILVATYTCLLYWIGLCLLARCRLPFEKSFFPLLFAFVGLPVLALLVLLSADTSSQMDGAMQAATIFLLVGFFLAYMLYYFVEHATLHGERLCVFSFLASLLFILGGVPIAVVAGYFLPYLVQGNPFKDNYSHAALLFALAFLLSVVPLVGVSFFKCLALPRASLFRFSNISSLLFNTAFEGFVTALFISILLAQEYSTKLTGPSRSLHFALFFTPLLSLLLGALLQLLALILFRTERTDALSWPPLHKKILGTHTLLLAVGLLT